MQQVSQLMADMSLVKSCIGSEDIECNARTREIARLYKTREQLDDEDFIANQVKCLGYLENLAERLRGKKQAQEEDSLQSFSEQSL